MNTRLPLPPVKAATVQFPPSCPVVFFRSSEGDTKGDTEKSSCAGNGGDDEHEGTGIINPSIQRHGTAVGLGIVRSVSIDLSPESGRQLFYTIEVLTKKRNRNHNKDVPPADSTSSTSASSSGTEDGSESTSDEPETIQVPEWSIRYAPNCPALFDLTCFNSEDDDHDAQDRPSTIVSNEVAGTTTASSVAKGIILCGLPTLSEDEDGVIFVYSALIHHTDDGDQFFEVHDIPLQAIRFDPTSGHRQVPSTDKASSPFTTSTATTTSISTSTKDNDATSPSFVCEENNVEDPTDAIDTTSVSNKDEMDKESKATGSDIEHTFNDPVAIQPNTNGGSGAKSSSKESSSPTSTSGRSSAKSSRRDRDGTPSPSKKSRSERSSEKKERRKKERRERSGSPRRSRRRDRRSRSRSRDRKSRSGRSRKHSYGSRSSRSRSLDHQRGRRSSSYDRYERRGRSPGRGHRSFSRSRSRERRERGHSRRRDRSSDDPSIRQRSCSVPAQPREATRPQGNHCIIEMPSKHLEYAISRTKDTSTTTPTWTPPPQVDKSRQVAFPRWLDIDSVVRAVSKHQQAFQEGQGFILSVENFRIKVSLDGIMLDPDISPADLPRALLVIKERLCRLVKDDGAYQRLLYDLAVFDIEKTGHYDGGPVHVVDPLTEGASSRYTDRHRPWRMILDIPYSQTYSAFHSKFVIGENGSRVLELERQFGCHITVFSLEQRGRHTSDMCRPFISIKSRQKQNVACAAEEIRSIIRQHQINCDCSLRM